MKLFFTLSKADILLAEQELVWRTYTAIETLLTTRKVEIIDKSEFAAILKADDKIFVVHVAALTEAMTIPIYPFCQAQVAALSSEETGILAEYSDFSNIFSSDSTAELPEHTRINNHPINLLNDKQPPYCPIYSPGPVEVEMLKTYIEANLASGFIRPSKFLAGTIILFVRKIHGSFYFCIDYRGIKNLTIKDRYLLPLTGKSLNCRRRAKRFTHLDLTNAYHRMRIRKGDK